MKTCCCSTICEKQIQCAKHSINNVGMHYIEDFYSYGSHAETADGYVQEEYWCGKLGDYKMFESVMDTTIMD